MSEQVMEQQEVSQEINQEIDLSPNAAEAGGNLSFDELDQLIDGRSGEELVREAQKISKQEKKSAEKDKPQIETNGDNKEREVKSEEIEEKEEIKKILARQGDNDIEIAATTMFRHKVNGAEVDVDLQELLNNYSGKISYDKKFQEFSSKKKEFETYKEVYDKDIAQINSYINTFAQKLKNEDALGALEYFAEFAGMKPHEFRRELLDQIAPEIFRRSELSPEQLQAEDLRTQNEYLLRLHESAQQRSQEEQALKELEMEIASVQEAHNISDEEFDAAYYDLKDEKLGLDEITPAVIADYHLNLKAFQKAEYILDNIQEGLSNQDEIINTLQDIIMRNPDFDDNDLSDIVLQVYNDTKNKASKSVSKKMSSQKQTTKTASPSKQEYLDWDDL